MEALTKDFLEYLSVQEANILDANHNIIKQIDISDLQIISGEKFYFSEMI